MQYCKKCTYPVVSVNLEIDDDKVCSGCKASEEKDVIDWPAREEIFKNLLFEYSSKKTTGYDCIIPVSGGKDSHYQAWYIKQLGLNPLLVSYYTHNYTSEADQNLYNIGNSLGIDHYIYRPSYKTIVKMNRVGFEMTGDMSWHFHCGAWTVPFRVGVSHKIPLLVYGEHGFTDLAGQFSLNDFPEFTRRQREEDVLRGFSHEDFIGKEDLTKDELNWCEFPNDEEIDKVGLRGIFMGNYLYWDANKHLKLAEDLGFKRSSFDQERTYRNFSNVDDIHENGIKDYMKFVKFGYGRATDHTSKDVRLGYISRDEGVQLVKQYDHVFPNRSFQYFSKMTGYSKEEFFVIADKFRDPRVWWIEDGLWWKDNIWGEKSSYGKVYLAESDWEKYKRY